MLALVLAGRYMKNAANVRMLMRDKLTELLPAAVRTLITDLFDTDAIEIPTWDSRCQTVVTYPSPIFCNPKLK